MPRLTVQCKAQDAWLRGVFVGVLMLRRGHGCARMAVTDAPMLPLQAIPQKKNTARPCQAQT